MSDWFSQYNYIVVIILMMTGLYIVFASRNLIKKLAGLSVFQTSVFLLYITIGKVKDAQPPILLEDKGYGSDKDGHALLEGPIQVAAGDAAFILPGPGSDVLYSNPLPHVLILTAIVVGVATLSIGLALTVRIREVYHTIEEDEIESADFIYNLEGTAD
ncbi:MAG: cation:proton antiporter subunit C [Litorimonas sp.]